MSTATKRKGAHPAIALVVFAVCAMTVDRVSAQVATFTLQQYPLLGNTHTAADFNGDGRPDLAGSGADVVSVMLGNGNGTFQTKIDFPVAAPPQSVTAGDFNSDGRVDVVAALNDPEIGLALLTGTGTGSFNPPTYFPNTSGFDSPAIAATDLNGDGRLDLVVMHGIAAFTAPIRVARSITVLLGNGNGTFQTPSEVDVGTGPMAMAVVDLNRDGIKDVAIGGGNTELSILLGVGNGTFVRQPVVTLVPGGDSFSACNDIGVGDLNRDGIQDLVVPLGNGHGNAILIGNGDGTFQVRSRIQIDETFAPLHVVVADFNRDGLLDIARTLGDGSQGLLQILRGNGDGTFQAPERYLVPPPSRGGMAIIAGDWNNDAKPDVAFVEGGAGAPTIDVATNTTGGVPPPPLAVASVSLNPATVAGGSSSTATVTLTAVAQASTTVAITSNNAAAIVPTSVVVPAGSNSRSFSVSTTQVPTTTSAVITASLNGTSRSATLTINPAASGVDTVTITRAEYDGGNRRLRIEATSTRSTATLQAFVTSSGQLIGTLSNDGGGRYRGEFSWPVNPQSVTVRSSLGGQATRTVAAR